MIENRTMCLEILKALGDDTRLSIMERLSKQELCACEIQESLELDIAQSSLSYHMKILTEAGVVSTTKEGKWTRYAIDGEKLKQVQALIDALIIEKSFSESEATYKCRC